MDLSGNPFVDTGLMVLAALAEKDHVSDLSLADIRRVFGDGRQLARNNRGLKCFTMVFGTNGPLTQPAYNKSGKNEEIYLGILKQLLDCADKEGKSGPRCDITGIRTAFDFHAACAKALSDGGVPVPEKKWIGRDWVPLGGSLGNDAQALPVASRPLHVSALALLALQYLPLGLFLFRGKLTCYQSSANDLTQALVSDVVADNLNRLSLGNSEILGKGSGTGIVLDFLIRRFELLKEESLPAGSELMLWLFSNSGTGADCDVEQVPERALAFVYEIMVGGFGSEVRNLIANEGKDSRFQLFECIRGSRDYRGLYSFKNWPGASPQFYELYQTRVCGKSRAALSVARKLSSGMVSGLDKKRLKEVRKPEFLNSFSGKNSVRRMMIENLTANEYDSLFPTIQQHPIKVDQSGWQFLRYYLSRQEEDARPFTDKAFDMKTTHPKIVQIAEAYVKNRDPRKIKNLLDRMAQRKVGIDWLEDVFCRMAEEHKDWDFGAWDEFVRDEDGKNVAFELFFQLRLYLSNLYREMNSEQRGVA